MPLVSFILPAYKARFLAEAIASILAQRVPHWELVIIDDASPEDLKAIVDTFADPRIRYYRNAKNIGGRDLVEQWNHCISYAAGEYLVLAADDDIYHPDYLKTCLDLAATYPDVNLIRARVAVIGEKNELLNIDGSTPTYCSKHAFLYYWLRATVFTCIGNYMFKTNALKDKGFVNFPSAFCSDAATAILLAEDGVANTQDMLFSFRISGIHLSSSKAQLDKKLEANTQFYSWLLDLNYERPIDELTAFFYKENNKSYIYSKCVYDYYNQVIKFLPWYKFSAIWDCQLLSTKDKWKMFARFTVNKLLGK